MHGFVGTIGGSEARLTTAVWGMQMDFPDKGKDDGENAGLRLVADNKEFAEPAPVEKQFVNFIFFRVNPEWRRLDPELKKTFRSEVRDVFADFEREMLLFSYSLVGFDSKADLMFWRICDSLDLIQDMTAKLYKTELGSFLETTDNYLSVTRKMKFVKAGTPASDREHVVAGGRKYHFLYPCAKQSEWYEISQEEREALIKENFMVGTRFKNIEIQMTHAFGFSEQEYLISFETDEPKDFLALAEELRTTPASKFTIRGMPVYTCRRRELGDCLESLG